MSEFPIIYITKNPENDQLITYFLQKIYNYYPVGFCHFRKAYPGYAEMEKIVQHKFEVECNDPNAVCNVFVDRLKNELSPFAIRNQNYQPFPNYSASILVSDVNNDSFRQETFIEVYISLLCDYYTVFLMDFYRFKEKKFPDNKVKDHHTIYSFAEIYGEQYNKEINIIKDFVYQLFPQKKFISHVFLTRYHIHSVEPFGEGNCPNIKAEGYSFFDLLFYYQYQTKKIKILE